MKRTAGSKKLLAKQSKFGRLTVFLIVAAVAVTGIIIYHGTRAAAPNRSGLPWNSGAGTASWSSFESFRNRPIDVWSTWNSGPDWASMEALWSVPQYNDTHFPGMMSFAQAPISNNENLSACANGGNDAHYRNIANGLKNAGWGGTATKPTFIRFAWEASGDWYQWGVGNGVNGGAATAQANLKSCWQHGATVFKSVSPYFKMDFNVGSSQGRNMADMYPGDQYVDMVGTDIYDAYPSNPTIGDFNNMCNTGTAARPVGPCQFAAFARAHGKGLSTSEWGIDSSNGGDNPVFIQGMYNFFVANSDLMTDTKGYEAYFDLQDCRFEITTGCNGNSAAKYKALFGGGNTPPTSTVVSSPTATPTPAAAQINQTGNLVSGKTFTSSAPDSATEPGNPVGQINDKNESSRWISQPVDGATASVDLGALHTLSKVSILWAADTIKNYDLQVSADSATWQTVSAGTTNNSQSQLINTTTFTATPTGRYFRIVAKDRWNAAYGNSIWEVGVYGTAASSLAGDVNHDNKVNVFDLSTLLSKWGTADAASDGNHDGTVNVFDLSVLLSHWTG